MAITAATYTSEFTWTANLAISVARLNNFFGTGPASLGGNTKWLLDNVTYSPAFASIFYASSSAAKTSGTTMAAVDTTNMRMSLTTNFPRVIGFWMVQGILTNTAHNAGGAISTLMDAATQDLNLSTTTLVVNQLNGASNFSNVAATTFMNIIPFTYVGVTVGSHTFDLCWKTDNSAGFSMQLLNGVRGVCWESR